MKCSNCNGDFTHEQAFIEHHCPRTSPPSLLGSQPPRAPKLLRTPPPERRKLRFMPRNWNEATCEELGDAVNRAVYERFPEPGSTYKEEKNDRWKDHREVWRQLKDDVEESEPEGGGWTTHYLKAFPRLQQSLLERQGNYKQKKEALIKYETQHPDATKSYKPFNTDSVESSWKAIDWGRKVGMGSTRAQLAVIGKCSNCGEHAQYAVQVLRDHGYTGDVEMLELKFPDGENHAYLRLKSKKKGKKPFFIDPWLNTSYKEGQEPEVVIESMSDLDSGTKPIVHDAFEKIQEQFPLPQTDDELERRYLGEEDKNLSLAQKQERIVRKYLAHNGSADLSKLHPYEIAGMYESIKKGVRAIDLNLSVRYLQHVRERNFQKLMLTPPYEVSRLFSDEDFGRLSSALGSPEFKIAYERLKEAGSANTNAKNYARKILETMLQHLHRMADDHTQVLGPGSFDFPSRQPYYLGPVPLTFHHGSPIRGSSAAPFVHVEQPSAPRLVPHSQPHVPTKPAPVASSTSFGEASNQRGEGSV